ncbi:hypothetical protein VFPFJ_02396 [Purpureocillium lilacinum]|uniref:Uncharacterized protein n=1 Tax=Purpureocillium lilacinum TaxID=33203 RepID=A0A179GNQ8_PURLI|nr:hypothetical protein VFPFJ_02396 [Purpureocillium lilacinum]OAQ79010.1 hypothetical protein VFPBJ_07131 [Purpureocillium lilacinum]OAQ93235.1 hypothetical protein VFPFJ_02396 [Purpureocillium lilacinum]
MMMMHQASGCLQSFGCATQQCPSTTCHFRKREIGRETEPLLRTRRGTSVVPRVRISCLSHTPP